MEVLTGNRTDEKPVVRNRPRRFGRLGVALTVAVTVAAGCGGDRSGGSGIPEGTGTSASAAGTPEGAVSASPSRTAARAIVMLQMDSLGPPHRINTYRDPSPAGLESANNNADDYDHGQTVNGYCQTSGRQVTYTPTDGRPLVTSPVWYGTKPPESPEGPLRFVPAIFTVPNPEARTLAQC